MIFKYAGKDATQGYSEVHHRTLIRKTLPVSRFKGRFAQPTPPNFKVLVQKKEEEEHPPLMSIFSAHDLEAVAKAKLSAKAYAYYSSAATDLVSAHANTSFWNRVWFRPRLLRNVTDIDTTCKIQGATSSVPFLVAPAAMAKLAHPDGELAIAKACKQNGVIQCVRIISHCSNLGKTVV